MNVVALVKTKKGLQGVQDLLDRVNTAIGTKKYAFENIYEGSWYPFPDYIEFMRAADKIVGSGDLSVCRDIGARLIKNMGTFSHLIDTKSMETLLKTARDRFHYIYSEGELEIRELSQGHAQVLYTGFPALEEVTLYFQGSFEGGMKMLHLDGKVAVTSAPASDDDPLEFTITWV